MKESNYNSENNSNKMAAKLLALLVSLLLHLYIFSKASHSSVSALRTKKAQIIDLDLVSGSKIVPESDIKESKIIPKTNRLASKNTFVKKEQIKRGKEGETKIKPKAKQSPRPALSPSPKLNPNPDLSPTLSPSLPSEPNPIPKNAPSTDPQLAGFTKFRSEQKPKFKGNNLSSYKPFKYLAPGSSAYLPGVREGEITLLNAKADQYAVFVRRVALQVFSALRSKNWSNLSFSQARHTRSFAVVDAKMNKDGKLVSANHSESSGSAGFDRVLLEAVNKGVWDKNPALSASLSDGNIHFIFKAKTWAEKTGDPPRERRWLLLSTGLK